MSVRSTFIPCKDIDLSIVERIDNFSFDSVWESLAPPEEFIKRGTKFRELFLQAVYNYGRYFPLMHMMSFSDSPLVGMFEWKSNFEEYLADPEIPDSKLILMPIMLIRVNGNGKTALRSVYYDEPWMQSTIKIESVLAKCRQPAHIELDESGMYTQNSGIYGACNLPKFLDYFKVVYCSFIQKERDHARLQLPIELYGNIDAALDEAKEACSTIQRTNSVPLDLWGMKGF